MSGGEIAGLALLTQERPCLTVGPFCVAPFDRVLIVQFSSVVCQRRPRYPSSILIHRGFRRLVRPERREAKGDHPRRDGRVVPSTDTIRRPEPTVASEVPATDGQQDRRATSKGSICLCGPRFAPSGCGSDMDQSHSIGCSEWPAVNRRPHARVGTQRNQDEQFGTDLNLPTEEYMGILASVEPRTQPAKAVSILVHSAPLRVISGAEFFLTMLYAKGFVNSPIDFPALKADRSSFQSFPVIAGNATTTSRLNITVSR